MITESTNAQIQIIAKAEGIDPDLLRAIILTESAGNPWAVRYEPAWKYFFKADGVKAKTTFETERIMQACSWGLCQVMGAVARELGYMDELPKLCQEDLGILYGAKKLKLLSRRYSMLDEMIAAYNSGIPKYMSNGKFFNQNYVDKVKAFYKGLRGQNEVA